MPNRFTGFDERTATRIIHAMQKVERMASMLARHRPSRRAESTQQRFIKITGSSVVSGHLWDYSFTEVVFDGDAWVTRVNGLTGVAGTDGARNTLELAHTATYVWGVDITAVDYVATSMEPKPVGGGGTDGTHKTDIIVPAWVLRNQSGDRRVWFSASGSHDGACS